MTDDDRREPLELRSTPDDATLAEGLARAYRPYAVGVAALFLALVPGLAVLRALDDGRVVHRAALAALTLVVAAWATWRGHRELVRAGVRERSGREAVVRVVDGGWVVRGVALRGPTARVSLTERAVVLRGRGVPAVVLARADVPRDVLARVRAR